MLYWMVWSLSAVTFGVLNEPVVQLVSVAFPATSSAHGYFMICLVTVFVLMVNKHLGKK